MQISEVKNKLSLFKTKLDSLGFEFQEPDNVMPGPTPETKLNELEELVGDVPALLREFYLEIGSVNFIGSHPLWEKNLYPDPIFISDIDYLISDAKCVTSDDEEYQAQIDNYGSLALVISPDYYHKEDVSGGPPYHIALPADDDPIILGMENTPRFSSYLGKVIKYGGFPGLESYEHNWPIENFT